MRGVASWYTAVTPLQFVARNDLPDLDDDDEEDKDDKEEKCGM